MGVAEGALDWSVRRVGCGVDDGRQAARLENLVGCDRRATTDQEMTRGDRTVEKAADKLAEFVEHAQTSGGVKGRLGKAMSDDPDFVRKLKPSLIVQRATGIVPTDAPAGSQLPAPAAPESPREQPGQPPSGLNPWGALGGAFATGCTIAKLIDRRGHADG